MYVTLGVAFGRRGRLLGWPLAGALCVTLAACSSITSKVLPITPNTPTVGAIAPTGRALVVGTAAGVVYTTLLGQFSVSAGTGAENPSTFDLVVFDGNTMTAQAIAANPAAGSFLRAGKAVLLLNNTETQRSTGLGGVLGGHLSGSSPATIFFVQRNKSGMPVGEVDIEFPQHVIAGIMGKPSATRPAKAAEVPVDAKAFLATFAQRFGSTSTSGVGPLPAFSMGATNYGIDNITPLTIDFPSAFTVITAPYGTEWCDDVSTSQNGVWGACTPNTNPKITDSSISADFETYVNVLLEPSGPGTYLHKVIARQYAYLDPLPYPDASWETTIEMADNANGTNNPNIPLTTMLGFNVGVVLSADPQWSGINGNPTMAITENQPTAMNNTSTLTTSESQTESVGVSVGGGYAGGGTGTIGANWSDSWTWSSADTINITDWSASSGTIPNEPFGAQYQYAASGNTQDTLANLELAGLGGSPNPGYNPPEFSGLQQGTNNLNALQQSRVVAGDETAWKSAGGLVSPSSQTFMATATFELGEAYQFIQSIYGNQYVYGNIGTSVIPQPIVIDFSKPALQPPASAPWKLSFGNFSAPNSGYQQIVGTVSLPTQATTPTTIYLSYVIQPQVSLLTLPVANACPANTSSFNPGDSVLSNGQNNGQPPLTITIPAGKTSNSFTLSFELFNTQTYNVQVVAWLPQTMVNGANVDNAQSAVCLTPKNA